MAEPSSTAVAVTTATGITLASLFTGLEANSRCITVRHERKRLNHSRAGCLSAYQFIYGLRRRPCGTGSYF